MTLKKFLEQSVVSKLDCIENKVIQMMNEDKKFSVGMTSEMRWQKE